MRWADLRKAAGLGFDHCQELLALPRMLWATLLDLLFFFNNRVRFTIGLARSVRSADAGERSVLLPPWCESCRGPRRAVAGDRA